MYSSVTLCWYFLRVRPVWKLLSCYHALQRLALVEILFIRQTDWINIHLDLMIRNVVNLLVGMSTQGTHSQGSGRAAEGSTRGRHLHAWGHSEGELSQSWLLLCFQNISFKPDFSVQPIKLFFWFESHTFVLEIFLLFLFSQASEQIYYGNTEGNDFKIKVFCIFIQYGSNGMEWNEKCVMLMNIVVEHAGLVVAPQTFWYAKRRVKVGNI